MADSTRWLTADEQAAWRGFLTVHARLAARMNQDLQRTSGLSLSDYDVLVHLTDVPDGRRRSFELCDAMEWEKSRLSKQVSRMVARGLVTREDCEEDRRGHYVVLTDAGWQAITDAAPAHVESVRRLVFDQLDETQVTALGGIVATLLDHLDGNSDTVE